MQPVDVNKPVSFRRQPISQRIGHTPEPGIIGSSRVFHRQISVADLKLAGAQAVLLRSEEPIGMRRAANVPGKLTVHKLGGPQ